MTHLFINLHFFVKFKFYFLDADRKLESHTSYVVSQNHSKIIANTYPESCRILAEILILEKDDINKDNIPTLFLQMYLFADLLD